MSWEKNYILRIKQMYPKGTKIICKHMADPYGVPPGTCGVVRFVDDAGTIHMQWETGSSLGLIYGEDSFEVIPDARV